MRLEDEHGQFKASNEVKLTNDNSAIWEGLFDTRRHVDRYEGSTRWEDAQAPETAEQILNRLGVFLGQQVLGDGILNELTDSIARRMLVVKVPSSTDNLLAAAFARVPWEIARPAPDQPALSPYHLAHEVGHFFGLFHPWDTPGGRHPVEIRDVDWADLWDLSYCHGDLGFPLFFTSRADALANQCTMEPIEDHYCPCGEYDDSDNCTCPVPPNCSVDNRYGADDSDMHCVIGYGNYYSDDPALKGLSFYLNEPELPPDSFAYGLNVMGYYSRYNAHLWTPGRFSSSQIEIISGHANNSVPIVVDYGVPGLLSDRDKLGEN